MNKKFLLALVLVFMATTFSASAQKFEKGSNYLSALAGFGSYGVPVTLHYERGVYDINSDMAIGVGATLGFSFYDNSTALYLMAKGAYHYTGFESWDLYGALGLGARHYGWDSATGFGFSTNIGARYFFNESFAIAAEAGYGVSFINLGVTYAF